MGITLSKEHLSAEDQKLLKSILLKNPLSISKEEEGIIRARRSYLNAEEKENFAHVLKGVKDSKPAVAQEEPEVTEEEEEEVEEVKTYPDTKRGKLMKTLDELGVKYAGNASEKKLEELLDASAEVVE